MPPKTRLASKEASLFKELLTLYEARQLKKGLKTADQILKKAPDHGETLCMKGLVLTHMGRREEGIELVKKGVRLDLTSHICWHVFGLIQKGEKNYEEALKSYTQALRFDKENMNILRDAATLQTHLRMFDALVDTRHTLLKLRPNVRQAWIALAVAHHLAGNSAEAIKVLEHYNRSLKDVTAYDADHSETLLFLIRLLSPSDPERALNLLDTSAKERAIVDKTAIMELRASLLSQRSPKSNDAEHAWRVLIEHNPDSLEYYHGYLSNQGVDHSAEPARALQILSELSALVPKAAIPKRLTLTIAIGEQFGKFSREYLLAGLKKGIPSLFVDIKPLYVDTAKLLVIQEIMESFKEDFTPPPPSSSNTTPPDSSRDPSTYVWILYFLGQHYTYLAAHPSPSIPSPSNTSYTSLALLNIRAALAHTPTLPELLLALARLLKHSGDPWEAAKALEEARLLDGQDRYLNTKAGKYWLRAGEVSTIGEDKRGKAEQVVGLFTKKDAASPSADLEDMQSLLYLLEEADAYRKAGKLGLALKRYVGIEKIFTEIEEDQYDFHGYALRKFTITMYTTLLKWEDRLRSHPAYIKTAISAAQIWVSLHDTPSLASSASAPAALTEAEKKARKKAAKKEKAAAAAAADKKTAAASTANDKESKDEDKGLEPPVPKDVDPDGTALVTAADPLERAAKILSPLLAVGSTLLGNTRGVDDSLRVHAWIAGYDVAVRRGKWIQAGRALNQARIVDSDHPELHLRVLDLKRRVSKLEPAPSASTLNLLTETVKTLVPNDIEISTYNSQYLQRNSHRSLSVLAAAKASAQYLDAPREEVEATIFTMFGEGAHPSVPDAQDALSFLRSLHSPRSDEFREKANEYFELSAVFKLPAEIEQRRQEALAFTLANPATPEGDRPAFGGVEEEGAQL